MSKFKRDHKKVRITNNFKHMPLWYNVGEEHEVIENDYCYIDAKDSSPVGKRRTIKKEHAVEIK